MHHPLRPFLPRLYYKVKQKKQKFMGFTKSHHLYSQIFLQGFINPWFQKTNPWHFPSSVPTYLPRSVSTLGLWKFPIGRQDAEPFLAGHHLQCRPVSKALIKVFPKIGVFPPKWMVKIMENPIKMDDLGVYIPIFGNTQNKEIRMVRGCCNFSHFFVHKKCWFKKIVKLEDFGSSLYRSANDINKRNVRDDTWI